MSRGNGATTTTTYPIPDRSNHIPNFTATGNHPTIDRGYATGTFRDGRAFRVDVWSQEQLWMFEFYFSIVGIETLTTEELVRLLEREGLITIARHDYRFVSAMAKDASGNAMHVVGSAMGDDDGTCVGLHVQLKSYEANTHTSARAAECDWSRPELRAALRTGSAVRAYDGAEFAVLDIDADGITTHGLFQPRTHWTWDAMTRLGMVIIESEDGPASPKLRIARERGGRFAAEEMWHLRRTGEIERSHRGMDLQLALELGRLASASCPGAKLTATVNGMRDGGFDIEVEGLEGHELARKPDVALRVAVARMYEWMEECQGVAWTSLTLTIRRVERRNFRYEIQFDYDG